jgi:hypothetical protein
MWQITEAGWQNPARRGLSAGERWIRTPPAQQFAARHSITSSARARIDGGTVRPSALAVLRLTIGPQVTSEGRNRVCRVRASEFRHRVDIAEVRLFVGVQCHEPPQWPRSEYQRMINTGDNPHGRSLDLTLRKCAATTHRGHVGFGTPLRLLAESVVYWVRCCPRKGSESKLHLAIVRFKPYSPRPRCTIFLIPPSLWTGTYCVPVDFCDPCSIRPNAVSVRREQYEVDVGIHASGATSMGTNQSYSPDFRLRPRPCQDDLEDEINAATVFHCVLPRFHGRRTI